MLSSKHAIWQIGRNSASNVQRIHHVPDLTVPLTPVYFLPPLLAFNDSSTRAPIVTRTCDVGCFCPSIISIRPRKLLLPPPLPPFRIFPLDLSCVASCGFLCAASRGFSPPRLFESAILPNICTGGCHSLPPWLPACFAPSLTLPSTGLAPCRPTDTFATHLASSSAARSPSHSSHASAALMTLGTSFSCLVACPTPKPNLLPRSLAGGYSVCTVLAPFLALCTVGVIAVGEGVSGGCERRT
jgi:hypothetical protein